LSRRWPTWAIPSSSIAPRSAKSSIPPMRRTSANGKPNTMPRRRTDIENEELKNLYTIRGWGLDRIASFKCCSADLVRRRLVTNGIAIRSQKEGCRKQRELHIPLGQKAHAMLDGELLGDGCLECDHGFQAYFSLSVGKNRKEWIQHIWSMFEESGMRFASRIYLSHGGWRFHTMKTMDLKEEWTRWYRINPGFDPSRRASFSNRRYVKIVPVNLKLSPLSLLHWYIGDGHRDADGAAQLCTQGFRRDEIEFLRLRLLEDFGIGSSSGKDGSIRLCRMDCERLLKTVGKSPVMCYNYKWRPIEAQCRSLERRKPISAALIDEFMARNGG
jgi:hypothetical protein